MDQLLSTKLYIPPLRSYFISRPRHSEQLNEGSRRKLTLVAAPTGFGKSTLVRGWLRSILAAYRPVVLQFAVTDLIFTKGR